MEHLSCDNSLPIEFQPATAAAGVAFVKFGFPYYTAYEMAEQLCKNAKIETKHRVSVEENSKSSLDFQIIFGGVTSDLKMFREKNYVMNYNNNEYKLHKRPYIFNEPGKFGYDDFTKKRSEIRSQRSKAKNLRNAYGRGVVAVETYSELLKARDKWDHKPFDEDNFAVFFDALDVIDFIDGGDKNE